MNEIQTQEQQLSDVENLLRYGAAPDRAAREPARPRRGAR